MLKSRPTDFKAARVAEEVQRVWPWLRTRQLKLVVHRVFPLSEAADAQRLLASSQHIGKIVLTTGL